MAKESSIEKARQAWTNLLDKAKRAVPNRLIAFSTSSNIELPDLFGPTSENRSEKQFLEKIGFPGEFPYTRGVQPTMYRSRRWTMRQYAGFGTAQETNQRYRYLLEQGTTGLSVAFDLPTQMGRDSDDPLSRGEVGRVGVPISTLEDMDALFDGINLEDVSTSMTINATAHLLLAFYLALAKSRGTAWGKLRGTVQNDVLKEYIARGTYIYPPKPALKIATDIFAFCSEQVPQWNTISISGYHIREAGSSAVQELAFTLANGIAYVEEAIRRGMAVDSFAPRLAFFFNCHNNFLEEIAKFRAARRLWARIMKERFKAKKEASMMLRFHTQTAGSTLTAQQPLVNVVRTTMQAAAAVLGGTQSLHTNSYDEALSLPTEESALLALRTQQVIAYETGLCDVVDPFGGSYAVEGLTDKLEELVLATLSRIDAAGGMIAAIEQGLPQREIEESAYQYQKEIEKDRMQVVGVNIFKAANEHTAVRPFTVDPKLEAEQIARVKLFKSKREQSLAASSLAAVVAAAKEDRNLMPPLIEAVRTGSTLGEISQALRNVFGEFRPR